VAAVDWNIQLPEEPSDEGVVQCTFCNSTRVPVERAFASSDGKVRICPDCVRLGVSQTDRGAGTAAEPENPRTCSFCERQQEFADQIFAAPQGAYICTVCLDDFAVQAEET
jgi:hypothetical protein